MIKVNTIYSLSNDWNLNECENRWTQLKSSQSIYKASNINLIDDFFFTYPIKDILLANSYKLIEIIDYIKGSITLKTIIPKQVKGKKSELHNIMVDIFIKNGFDKMNKGQFTRDNERKVCPYCNRNYICILPEKRLNIPLDHFYPKAIYPFLAASVNNLFPCCPTCNSGLKGCHDTYLKKIIHPCEIDIQKRIFKFDILSSSVNDIKPADNSINIKVINYNNNDGVFLWEKIYNAHHKDEVIDLITKQRCYLNPIYIKSIKKFFPKEVNDDDIKRYLLGSYYNHRDHHRKPLSKFVYDMASQLGII